ncbi:MAG: hypothetical protein ACRD03_11500 [Acidimicrobiales bacterium]
MSAYDDLVAGADAHAAAGEHKEASIDYGRALGLGGAQDRHCRCMRGVCARRVGEQRLDMADQHPDRRSSLLDQAARWLTKSEASLASALEGADDRERARVRLEQARTEEVLARHLVMCGGDPGRRLSEARRHREAAAMLSRTSTSGYRT